MIADKYKLRPLIKLQHRIARAQWSEEKGKWDLTIKKPKTSSVSSAAKGALNSPNYDDWEEFHDSVDVLFSGVGSLSRWTWPDIPGLETFSGKVIHSAQWNTMEHEEQWKVKNVAVIGVVRNCSEDMHMRSNCGVQCPGLVGSTDCPLTATESEAPFQLRARSHLDLFGIRSGAVTQVIRRP
jgi:hypothetical protein